MTVSVRAAVSSHLTGPTPGRDWHSGYFHQNKKTNFILWTRDLFVYLSWTRDSLATFVWEVGVRLQYPGSLSNTKLIIAASVRSSPLDCYVSLFLACLYCLYHVYELCRFYLAVFVLYIYIHYIHFIHHYIYTCSRLSHVWHFFVIKFGANFS